MKNFARKRWSQIRFFLYRKRCAFLKFYIRYLRTEKPETLHFYYHRLARKTPQLHIIQVGANDGIVADPLRDILLLYPVKAVLAEPHPVVFREFLQPLYANREEIITLHTAIGEEAGSHLFYTLSFSNKRWATGLSGFNRNFLEQKINQGYVASKAIAEGDILPRNPDDWIHESNVPCITFDDMLDLAQFQEVDILQLDTEGYDEVLIRSWPFHRVKPQLIGFEKNEFDPAAQEALVTFLHNLGYEVKNCGRDALASLSTR